MRNQETLKCFYLERLQFWRGPCKNGSVLQEKRGQSSKMQDGIAWSLRAQGQGVAIESDVEEEPGNCRIGVQRLCGHKLPRGAMYRES